MTRVSNVAWLCGFMCLCVAQVEAAAKMPRAQAIAQAKRIIKSQLVDPGSANFEISYVDDQLVCGRVNAKNRMGGYNGFEPFMVGAGSGDGPVGYVAESRGTSESAKAVTLVVLIGCALAENPDAFKSDPSKEEPPTSTTNPLSTDAEANAFYESLTQTERERWATESFDMINRAAAACVEGSGQPYEQCDAGATYCGRRAFRQVEIFDSCIARLGAGLPLPAVAPVAPVVPTG